LPLLRVCVLCVHGEARFLIRGGCAGGLGEGNNNKTERHGARGGMGG
jgi:hypothetical protein